MIDKENYIIEKYKEGCHALRHYSNHVLNIRTLTIAQGLVIFGSIIYLLQNNLFLYLFFIGIFGFFFSISLFILHRVYYEHFNNILEKVINLESYNGPWTIYYCKRAKKLENVYYKAIHHYIPFLFFIISMFLIIIYSFLIDYLNNEVKIVISVYIFKKYYFFQFILILILIILILFLFVKYNDEFKNEKLKTIQNKKCISLLNENKDLEKRIKLLTIENKNLKEKIKNNEKL